MNTFLSAAQQAVKDQYSSYVKEHLAPVATELRHGETAAKDFLQQLGREGYLGLTVPKEYGGAATEFLNPVLLSECIGEYLPGLAIIIAEHAAVIELIKKVGSETQKSRYLPLLARGEVIAATAFHEESAGSDLQAAKTTAEKQGDQFVLTGTKTAVVNANDVGLCLVSAYVGDSLSMFLVDLSEDRKSISVENESKLSGIQPVTVANIRFDAHKISADSRIGVADSADQIFYAGGAANCIEQISFAGDVAKTLAAAAAVGLTEKSLASSAERANTREQFGKPIGALQGIQWKIADMSVETSAARLLVYRAAWSKDANPDSFRKDACMCKWFAAKTARIHSGEAVQIFGLQGLLADSEQELFYRDAKALELCEGTSEYQKVLLANELKI